jgi:hypothetical protein
MIDLGTHFLIWPHLRLHAQRAVNFWQRAYEAVPGPDGMLGVPPRDYKYDDVKPGSPVMAGTILGGKVKLKYPKSTTSKRGRERAADASAEIDSRGALADWLTSSKNPLFAKVIANRMWARTFGAGLVEPLDDWKKDTVAVHPELLDHLAKLMVDLDFDLRQFERVLVQTTLFQRETPAQDPSPEAAYTFAGPLLRRMTAEQIWDSLLTLVFDDVDERLREPDARARPVYEQFAQIAKLDAKGVAELVKDGRPAMAARVQQERREEARMQREADAEMQKRARPLLRQLAIARRNGDTQRVAQISDELERMGYTQRARRGREGDLVRASDLQQPAPPGHLLRQFGQSDRGTVDGASPAATVPQVLTLLNGFLDQRVLEGRSALRRDLEAAADGERRVRVAFLTTLNREPTPDELQQWRRAIAIDGPDVIKDLVWVLCNSNEFRFVR